jgi:hypothetical protein
MSFCEMHDVFTFCNIYFICFLFLEPPQNSYLQEISSNDENLDLLDFSDLQEKLLIESLS